MMLCSQFGSARLRVSPQSSDLSEELLVHEKRGLAGFSAVVLFLNMIPTKKNTYLNLE